MIDSGAYHIININIDATIVLSGAPRTGTTWIMEIFESLPKYRSIFEPFNRSIYPEVNKVVPPPYRPYVPIYEDNAKIKKWLIKVFSGKCYGFRVIRPSRFIHELT